MAARIGAPPDQPIHPYVSAFAEILARDSNALAVLFYGSNLRTGSLEGVLDFYVLLPGGVESGIWPRVSYRELTHDGVDLRAKIATMTIGTFAAAARGETIDTTIWARFVQPSALVWQRDPQSGAEVRRALSAAARTAARLAVALGPEQGSEEDYWRALFQATYRAELRVEKPGREDSILSANRAHFRGLLPSALRDAGIGFSQEGDIIAPRMNAAEKGRIRRWWRKRRRLGKPLNIVRLIRATTTFEGAARYAAWKIERHTGIAIEVTPWRENHPVLAAPGVAWTLWRARRKAGRA
ncbi:hypothetical protein WYH_02181 [Croceibacterium atlanticum]|uniref:Phosphatidate cytidylyltransferase n=1 Tax=Croceibacterium atlanticum TaxID=1267766 RepID=A0A0F7KUC4_9SPHN|nr:hypothetical protein [Croceibacterium atlanticum]AKH43214.1 hypothetical protein WYH_02181 [Croceibacterium atlanticum]